MSEGGTAEHGLVAARQTAAVMRTDGFGDWFCSPWAGHVADSCWIWAADRSGG